MNRIHRVTDIQIKKENPKLVEICIDNNVFLETNLSTIADLDLSVNSIITPRAIELIQKENDLTMAKRDSLRFLSYRPRSEWEIKKKLLDKEYPLYIVEEALNWLKEKEFINDRDFSLKWIKYQLSKKPFGKIKLKNELRKKGIDKEIINSVIDSFFEQKDELELAYQLITKKYNSIALKNIELNPKDIIKLLKSRGFSSSIIEQIGNGDLDYKILNLKNVNRFT